MTSDNPSKPGRLLEEIRKDPAAVFGFEARLPSGNVMRGTVGPLVGDRLCIQAGFAVVPPSAEDINVARAMLDEIMGQPPAICHVVNNAQEREASKKVFRKFMGGGQG